MNPRRKFWTIVAVFTHLSLVVAGAAYYGFDQWGRLGKVLDVYGAASGANSSYGFFAPDVGGQVRARFEITDRDGHHRFTDLASGLNHESDLRINGIMSEFVNEDPDPERFDRSLAASLAGTIFGRYPQAVQVQVTLEEFWPVSMADYRAGQRAEWKSFYQIRFAPVTERIAERRAE